MTGQDRMSALDGLRGLAVIGVLLFHDGRLSGGFLGVDLFFVLSGFLITSLLLREVSTAGTLRLGRFWERRYRRLLPAFVVLLIAILPMMSIWGGPAQLDSARRAVLPALAHAANWHEIFNGADYWALFSDPSPLTHLWSLGIEQQFYLVWPVVVLLVARLRRWRAVLASVTVTLIGASAVLLWVLYDPSNTNRWYEGTDTRVSSILLGALIAIVDVPAMIGRGSRDGKRSARIALELTQWGLVACLGYVWWSVDGLSGDGLAHGGLVVCSALAALLIAGLASPAPTSLQRVLSVAPLRGAGAVSYGWYLWHWPIYVILTTQRTGLHGWALSGARWSVSLAAALVSYFLIEMPIRSRHVAVSPRSLIATCAGASVLVTGLVVLIPRPVTTPAAFDTASIVALTQPTTSVAASGEEVPTPTRAPSHLRDVDSIIWSGDSGAFEAAPALTAALAATGVSVRYAGYPGTGIAPQPKRWSVFVQPVLDDRPDVVMFQLSGWDSNFSVDEQRNAFTTYTDAVLDTGAAMVFIAPPPVDTTHVRYNVTVMLELAKELAKARPQDVVVLDSLSFWGPFAFDIEGDGVPDRKPDGTHLCPQGAAKYANWLTAQLAVHFDGIDPAPPEDWASGPWTTDGRYDNPLGACVALS